MPHGARAATGPETSKATLGYIALTDSAPLIIAKERGLFAKYGMADVEVTKQASWGGTRDNLVLGGGAGGIDGAHILTPLPYLMQTGKVVQNGQSVPMSILARLNTNGQAISVSKALMSAGAKLDSAPLRMKFWADHASYPFQSHELWFLTEDIRWGVLGTETDTKALIAAVNRQDIWRSAASLAGVAAADMPSGPSRGVETFFDGKSFDPANPAAYLAAQSIKKLQA